MRLAPGLIGLAFALTLACTPTHAQPYPAKPIRIIVPYPAGGVLDTLTRAIGGHARTALGQPWVIENRVGASGAIGLQACATASPTAIRSVRSPPRRCRSRRMPIRSSMSATSRSAQ